MPRDTEYKGTVTRVIFRDVESDFAILKMSSDKGPSVKIKGHFHGMDLEPGSRLEVTGHWVPHPKYDDTLQINRASPLLDTDEGVRRYLKKNVDGVGSVTATKLVEQYGSELPSILDDEPGRLVDAPYLSDKQRENLLEKWSENQNKRRISIFMMNLQLPGSTTPEVEHRWGDAAIEKIRENPYLLLEIPGIGFKRADRAAFRLNVDRDAPERLKACVNWVLRKQSTRSGHLYVEESELLRRMRETLENEDVVTVGRPLSDNEIEKMLSQLEDEGEIVREEGRVYPMELFHAEDYCARRIATWKGAGGLGVDVDEFLEKWEADHGFVLSDEQRQAVEAVNESGFVLVTGLPGTGKTTVTKALVSLFDEADMKTHLMSPTGIAAKKLATVVGDQAATIHRTLKYKGSGKWGHNAGNRLAADAVIVDEVSMVSQELLYRLLAALRDDVIVVLVGDHAQLPSVGAGNVLHELIRSGRVPRVNLTEIFRQEEASDIVLNAHRINDGELPEVGDPTDSDTDFKFVQRDDDRDIKRGIVSIAEKLHHSDSKPTFQILSPRYAGRLGVDSINKAVRDALNPKARTREIKVGGDRWRRGDKVMITENDYDLDVYNGEIATINRINSKNKVVELSMLEGETTRLVKLDYSDVASMLTLAYCTTIHKSQGKEFDWVVFPYVKAFGIQLERNLLYTAITRAKEKVVVLGEWAAVARAVRTQSSTDRNTMFAEKIGRYA